MPGATAYFLAVTLQEQRSIKELVYFKFQPETVNLIVDGGKVYLMF